MCSSDLPLSWGIRYYIKNEIHEKYGDSELVSISHIIITRNGEDFYTIIETRDRGLYVGIDKARLLIDKAKSHPLDFNMINFDSNMIGRKLLYKDIEYTIVSFCNGIGNILIQNTKFDTNVIPVDIFSEEINWFVYYNCVIHKI